MGGLINAMEPCCAAPGGGGSIVGTEGTKNEFNTAVTDGNFLFVGDATMEIGAPITGGTATYIPYIAAGPVVAQDAGITYVSGQLRLTGGLQPVSSSTIGGPGITLNAANAGVDATTFQGSGANMGQCGKTSSAPYFALSSIPGGGSAFDAFMWGYGANDISFGNSTARDFSATVRLGTLITKSFTVGTLPSGIVAQRAFVTDETTGVFRATLVGGGAIEGPAHYANGQWRNG
jgi:hypothetical protein